MASIRSPKFTWLANPLVASRGILVLLTFVAAKVLPVQILGSWQWSPNIFILGAFSRWDSTYYVTIAQSGYVACASCPSVYSLYAFRPLYPMIIRFLSIPFSSATDVATAVVIGGFLWNLVAVILIGIYFQKLISLILGKGAVKGNLLLLAVYPSTIFLTAIYPESTFILLIVLTFYYLEKGNIYLSGLFGLLAGFTRPEGILLFIPFVWKLRGSAKAERIKLVIAGAGTVLSTIVFALYAFLETGRLLLLLEVEQSWPRVTITKAVFWQYFVTNQFDVLGTAVMAVALATVFFAIKSKRFGKLSPYYAWAIVTLLFFLFFTDPDSWARRTLSVVPVLWTQAYYLRWPQSKLFYGVASSYALLAGLCAILFMDWYFVL